MARHPLGSGGSRGDTYVSRILTTLDLRDRVQIAVLAYESGLVTPSEDPDPSRP